jgi:hypothetical protein
VTPSEIPWRVNNWAGSSKQKLLLRVVLLGKFNFRGAHPNPGPADFFTTPCTPSKEFENDCKSLISVSINCSKTCLNFVYIRATLFNVIYCKIIVVKLQTRCLFLYCRYLVMVNSSLWLQKQSSRRNPKSASISNFEADSSKNLKKSENLAKSIWRRFLLLKIEFCPWVKILNSWFIEGFHQNEQKNVLKEARLSFFCLFLHNIILELIRTFQSFLNHIMTYLLKLFLIAYLPNNQKNNVTKSIVNDSLWINWEG